MLGAFVGLLLAPSTFPNRGGLHFLLAAIIVTVANDVGALVFGKLLGRHAMASSISPNKTWEGAIGAAVVTILAGLCVSALPGWTVSAGIALGIAAAVLVPLGDLCESMVKRYARPEGHGEDPPGPWWPARPNRRALVRAACDVLHRPRVPPGLSGHGAPLVTPTLAILGATGSVGTQALDVLASHPDAFTIDSLSARRSLDELCALAARHRPRAVVVADEERARAVAGSLPARTEVLVGADGLAEAAAAADVVLNGVVGFAGVPATLAALSAGRHLALANKESLDRRARPSSRPCATRPGRRLLPVDSEHCAIHQCLAGLSGPDPMRVVRRLVLTASGGPFRGRDARRARARDRRRRPRTPDVGDGRAKITVDCSTLMNKGLEVLEAAALFAVPVDRIDVVVHPQSIVHSMVELVDGSTLAQLSRPDMRLPDRLRARPPVALRRRLSGASTFDEPLTLDLRAARRRDVPVPLARVRGGTARRHRAGVAERGRRGRGRVVPRRRLVVAGDRRGRRVDARALRRRGVRRR